MTDFLTQIEAWAQELGATHARTVNDRSYLEVKQEVRDACLANACGRSGRCWTCPPYGGELEGLGETIASFPGIVLVQSIATLEDSWDFEGMEEAARAHNQRVRDLGQRVAEQFPDCAVLVLGCGGCGYCAKCSCPDEPCRFPEQALGSVEGCGLEISSLVQSVGLKYVNGKNTVSYVGAVLVRCPE
ncbi:MAG TPA: DUF2284 domain-containing protein [Armatimonadota bacterium]|jgi:predicted metal-binding protein